MITARGGDERGEHELASAARVDNNAPLSSLTAMKDSPANADTAEQVADARTRSRAKREWIYAGLGLVLGFAILPLLIYLVGTLVLGVYAGGKSLGAFYANFYVNLAHGSIRTWFIGLAPYLAFWFVRLCFWPFGARQPPESPPVQAVAAPAHAKSGNSRREPFISA